MAPLMQPWLLILCIFFVFFTSTIHFSVCQSDSPRNIETFYPFESPPVAPPTPTTPNNPPANQEPVHPLPPPPKSSSSNNTVLKAVVATAASTLVLAGLLFFFIQRRSVARRRKRDTVSTGLNRVGSVAPVPKFDGNLKGFIVDENGLDVVYWRKLEGIKYKNSYRKEVLQSPKNEEEEEEGERNRGKRNRKSDPMQETPLLRGKSSTSEIPIHTDFEVRNPILPKTPPRPPPPPPRPVLPVMAIPKKDSPAPPQPPPPPITAKKNHVAPPPPPTTGGSAVPPRPPPAPGPIRKVSDGSKPGETSSGDNRTETGNDQVKLKPLHWDKVNASTDHSMVWHKLDGGSFRFDGDLMEALFGSVASNRKSPQRNTNSSNPNAANSVQAAQIFILDSRKSQNTAIVLRSLAISRKEILDALIEGHGLNVDTLEKLTRIAPTKEEESQIIAFNGDPIRLADAESFLYHILRAVPLAFPRLDAMFFRSNYVFEILHLKEFIQTLDSGCKELRTRGLFLKLLEAVLKSGNRMNAGTARGNAQAFNLTALTKLSDVKSTDGKTTLLHFVVEEVIRSEGKRCVVNRNPSLTRSSSRSSNSSENSASMEEREREYIKLGLPIVGGLSSEFANVKKAAIIDYDGFAKTCSTLTARLADIQQIVAQCATSRGEGGGFVREMTGFIESAEGELKEVREEQTRVMELVRKTTEYYQAGASKDREARPLQLFVIVKDFLGMVDKVCVDIARNMQKRRTSTTTTAAAGSSSSPKSPAVRSSVKFPILPAHFMSDKSRSTSSESSDDS